MPIRYTNPLAGHPRTVERPDANGYLQFRIIPCELTPQRAQTASALTGLFDCALIAGCGYAVLRARQLNAMQIGGAAAVCLAAHSVFKWVVCDGLRKTTVIDMTTDSIRVRGWFGWKAYSRDLPHQFLLLPHDLAREEANQNDFEVRKASTQGRVIRKSTFYGDSYHVVLAQAGQRIDLLTVYGLKAATTIVTRLQYCDMLLDAQIGKGNTFGATPEHDWRAHTPGGL